MLKVLHVTKKYKEKSVLQDITFTLQAGRMCALIGNNGAGKTTLLNGIANQLKFDEGSVWFHDHERTRQDMSHIAYLPDHSLFDDSQSIAQIIQDATFFFDDFDNQRMEQIVFEMGLDRETKLAKLSAGMRKKLELAITLSRKAQLFLLDEPFANLDPLVRQEMMQLIIQNVHEEAAYLISTHQVQAIETYMDETILLKDGRILLQGKNDELRDKYQCTIEQLLLIKLKGGEDDVEAFAL